MCFYMVDYSNVKICKIVCYETCKEYIGSTCAPSLSRRLSELKRKYKLSLHGKFNYTTSFDTLKQL